MALHHAAVIADRAGQSTRAGALAELARVQLSALGDEAAIASLPSGSR